jgi:hypothetical protein
MTRRRPTVEVTDHAVIRWLERVERFDIVALRNQIAASAEIGIAHGARTVVIGGGKLVITDGAVVTVLLPHQFASAEIGHLQIDIAGEIDLYRRTKRSRR